MILAEIHSAKERKKKNDTIVKISTTAWISTCFPVFSRIWHQTYFQVHGMQESSLPYSPLYKPKWIRTKGINSHNQFSSSKFFDFDSGWAFLGSLGAATLWRYHAWEFRGSDEVSAIVWLYNRMNGPNSRNDKQGTRDNHFMLKCRLSEVDINNLMYRRRYQPLCTHQSSLAKWVLSTLQSPQNFLSIRIRVRLTKQFMRWRGWISHVSSAH